MTTTFEPRHQFLAYMADTLAAATYYGERVWLDGPQQIQHCANAEQAEYLVTQLTQVNRLRQHKFWVDGKFVMMLRRGNQ